MNLDRDLVAQAPRQHDIGEEIGRGASGIVLVGHTAGCTARSPSPASGVRLRRGPASPVLQEGVLAGWTTAIVPIYDYVEHQGVCLLVVECLAGGTLRDRAQAGLTAQESCVTMIAACSALQHAHERSTLHR